MSWVTEKQKTTQVQKEQPTESPCARTNTLLCEHASVQEGGSHRCHIHRWFVEDLPSSPHNRLAGENPSLTVSEVAKTPVLEVAVPEVFLQDGHRTDNAVCGSADAAAADAARASCGALGRSQ